MHTFSLGGVGTLTALSPSSEFEHAVSLLLHPSVACQSHVPQNYTNILPLNLACTEITNTYQSASLPQASLLTMPLLRCLPSVLQY